MVTLTNGFLAIFGGSTDIQTWDSWTNKVQVYDGTSWSHAAVDMIEGRENGLAIVY